MRKFYSFLIAAFALLTMISLPGKAVGENWSHNFSSGEISTSAGDITLNNKSWTQTAATYVGWDNTKGIQIGSGNNPTSNFSLSTSAFSSYTITNITVNSSIASKGNATMSIKVGNTTYLNSQSLTTTATGYSCTPNASGSIEISWANSVSKAFYVKSISITYTSNSSAVATTTTITVPSGFNNDLKNGTAAGTLTASVTETANGNAVSGATVTWESSNTDVATINASGVVTLKAVGNTTITASYAGTNAYEASSEDYELEVVDSRYLISDLTFTAACGGTGTADDGAEWTVTSDANESNFDSGRGIHYGTNSATVTYVQLTTSDIDGEIKKVVVNASDAQGTSTISVSVGGVAFTCTGSTTVTNSNPGVDYTFNGTGTGEIIVRLDRGTAQTKAIYVKSVKVTYQEPAVKAPQITVPETFVGSTTATINCETTGATIKYNYDGGSTWNTYSTALNITETTTIYAKAVLGEDESSVVSKTTTKTQPTPTVTISTTGITNPDVYGGTTAGSLSATVTYNSNAISGASVTWSGNADAVATINASTGAVTLVSAGQVTFTATFAGNADYLESSATYVMTVTNTDPNRPGTQDNPYTVAQAISAIAHNGYVEDVYATGIVSSIVTAYGTNNYSNITFDIVDPAGDEAYLRAYRCGGTNADQVAVGDVVVVSGTMTYYNSSIYEFNQGCELVSLTHPVNTEPYITIESDEFELTAAVETGELEIEYGNFTLTSFDIQFYDNENNELYEGPDWLTLAIEEDGGNYSVSYATVVNEGTARTAYFKVYDGEVYSNLVTITQAAPVVDYAYLPFEWDNTTTPTGITLNNVGTYSSSSPHLKMNNNNGEGTVILKLNSDPGAITFDIKGNPSSGTASTGTFSVMISNNGKDYTTLASYTSIINQIQTKSFTDIAAGTRYIKWSYTKASNGNVALGNIIVTKAMPITETTTWTAGSFTPTDNHTYIVENGATLTLSGDFSAEITDASQIIVKDGGQLITSNAVAATVQKNINTAAANWTSASEGWYFIAHPIVAQDGLNASDLGLITDDLGANANNSTATYDLYKLDGNTWTNYRKGTFTLNNGTGYLYASREGLTVNFAGTVNHNTSKEVSVTEGWNLVGNPFTYNAYINAPYYVMTSTGTLNAEVQNSGTIAPCTGVVVKATTDGSVTFSKTDPSSQSPVNPGNISMVLAQTVTTRGGSNAETLDNAIVSFNEGSQLEKFYFGNQNANIYIPQNGEEYAIVSAEAQGEMPVSFKANEDGQYTITVNANEVEMNYLHLIDNLTGANVDLLANPSYTFDAKTTDYTSRFRLVFSANEANAENDDFAFFSNGQIILNGDNSNATLQVIDMMGRIVSTQQVNDNAAMAPVADGVYVLRLINGSDIKTQKIVVR